MDSHNIAICNDATGNMFWLPPIEPYEANAIKTFARLVPLNGQIDVDHITNGQFIANNHNTKKCNVSSNSIIPLDNQSTIILQQFGTITEELKTFTKQVSSYISKMTQAHNTVQEYAGKLIENVISQALIKSTGYSYPLIHYSRC